MSDRHAVLVSVSTFDDGFDSLQFTDNDVCRLAAVLVEHCDFAPENVCVLTLGGELPAGVRVVEPTRTNILRSVQEAAEVVGPDGLFLVYVATHGFEASGTPYFLAKDSSLKVIAETAIEARQLSSKMELSKAKCNLRFYDACRPDQSFARGNAAMSRALESTIFNKASGWVTFSSCSSGELAFETPSFQQGVFSHYLCQGMSGDAASENGDVTVDRLIDYVKLSVSNWSRENKRKQTPHVESNLSGTLILANCKPKTSESEPTPTANPLAVMAARLQELGASQSDSLTNLRFTSEIETRKLRDRVFSELLSIAKESLRGPYKVELCNDATSRNNEYGFDIPGFLTEDARKYKVHKEKEGLVSFGMTMETSDVTLPRVQLCAAVARFSCFYWVWWIVVCNRHKEWKDWAPTPQTRRDLITLTPVEADSEDVSKKAAQVLTQALAGATCEWSEQVKMYWERKMAPVASLQVSKGVGSQST